MAIEIVSDTIWQRLSWQDAQVLRKLVWDKVVRHFPAELRTQREIDRYIESRLPLTVEKAIKQAVDNGYRG